MGYRWFDTKKIEPLFPFGYGLSYPRFFYLGLRVQAGDGPAGESWSAEFTLANVGDRAGAEVAQLYDAGLNTIAMQQAFLQLLRGECPEEVVWCADLTHWVDGKGRADLQGEEEHLRSAVFKLAALRSTLGHSGEVSRLGIQGFHSLTHGPKQVLK